MSLSPRLLLPSRHLTIRHPRRPCCSFVISLLFVALNVRYPCSHLSVLAFAGVGVGWRWRALALAFTLALAFAGVSVRCRWCSLSLTFAVVGVRWRWHSLAFLFVVLRSIVVSTTITPYEQWLAGGVVALSDVALGMGVAA